MATPARGATIDIYTIRANFSGGNLDAGWNAAYNTNMLNMAWYRGRYYYSGYYGNRYFPSTGALDIYTYFTAASGNCNCCCQCCCGGTTCFLGSSYTTMADGSRKMIRDVKIGDWLMGAFGEANQVLASEDLILGDRPMFVINYTHHTTADHPHVTVDKGFVVIDPEETLKEWGAWFRCELADGSFVMLNNIGLDNAKDRIKQMYIGDKLQTISGPAAVERIDDYYLPPDTKLYNFVMSGSHTYSVDGYFVTGWPRDDDFDYVEWKQKGETSKVEDWMESK